MSSLSKTGFIQGAQAGVNVGNSILNNIEHRKDTEQLRGLRDLEESRRAERHTMAKESHDLNNQIKHLQTANAALQNNQLVNGLMARQAYAVYMSNRNEKGGSQFEPSKEEMELLSLYPNLSTSYILGDEYKNAVAFAKRAIEEKKPELMNTPEGIAAFDILNPELNAGVVDGRKRKTKGLYPGKRPGTFVVDLDVEGETTGKPMTVNRSSDPQDEVAQIPLEKIVKKVASAEQLINLFSSKKGLEMLMYNGGIEPPQQFGDVYTDPKSGLAGQKNLTTNQFTPVGGRGGRGSAYQPSVYGKYVRDLLSVGYKKEEADKIAQKWMAQRKTLSREDAIRNIASDLMQADGGSQPDEYIRAAEKMYDSVQPKQEGEPTAPSSVDDFLSEFIDVQPGSETKTQQAAPTDTPTQASPAADEKTQATITPEQKSWVDQYTALKNKPRSGRMDASDRQQISDLEELLNYYGVPIPDTSSANTAASGGRNKTAATRREAASLREAERLAALREKYSTNEKIAGR